MSDITPVNVSFSFVDKNGNNATRTFKVEKGIEINFNGKSYKVEEDGVVDLSNNEKITGSIMSTKETIAALQGLSQVNADEGIQRGKLESVLTAKDIEATKNGVKDNFIQTRVNGLAERLGSDYSIHDYSDLHGWGIRYDYKNGDIGLTMSENGGKNRAQSVNVSSEQSRTEAEEKAKEWHWYDPSSWPIWE